VALVVEDEAAVLVLVVAEVGVSTTLLAGLLPLLAGVVAEPFAISTFSMQVESEEGK
jgi:hypothetical protein